MPEGDTIARAAATLDRALAGATVTRFATGLAHLARVDADTPIAGRVIERCESRGKHLLVHFSDGLVLRTHMRMHGSWHLYRPGERWRRPARAARFAIETADWVAVGFDVPIAEFLDAATLEQAPALARLGPDLREPGVDAEALAARLLEQGARPVGEALLDQRVFAGIGNVFRSELLFMARLHPSTPAGSLTPDQARDLVAQAQKWLAVNARADGPGRRNTTGRLSPAERVWVYQRTGFECRRCGAEIRSAVDRDARRMYWCPACQPAVGSGP
jgi:endonuclease-8